MKSNLTDITILSPNCNKPRKHPITRITPHIMVGQISAQRCGEIFAQKSRQASANYGIGKNGEIGCYVEEENRSWASGNRDNDERSITIECASNTKAPYVVYDTVYDRLVDLCEDICRRYKYLELIYKPNTYTTEELDGNSGHMIITVHKWYQATECCGQYLINMLPVLANEVTSRLKNVSRETFPQLWIVHIPNLFIRTMPTFAAPTRGFTGIGVFTITEKSGNWGKLKSGAGWIWLGDERWTSRRD